MAPGAVGSMRQILRMSFERSGSRKEKVQMPSFESSLTYSPDLLAGPGERARV